MATDDLYATLTVILREVFEDEELVARPDLTADDVADWDSLSHLRLIMTVQKRFGIKFSAGEIGKLTNVGDLARLITAKVSERGG
jgi:acyl carrier protein